MFLHAAVRSAVTIARLIADECEYCGAVDGVHAGDCPSGLAQDLESGAIRPRDDSYSDALEAYRAIYGQEFRRAS